MKYSKLEGEKVWAAFKDMKLYLDKSFQVFEEVDCDNFYTNQKKQKIYDGVSTLLNTNIGHKNQEMINAIAEQLNTMDNTTLFTVTSNVEIECAKKLCDLTNNYFFSCFFTNSGSEACDTALKIALKYNYIKGKKECGVVSLKGAYHGSNMTAMRICQTQYNNKEYYINCNGYYQIDTPDSLERPDKFNQEQWIDECIRQYRTLVENNNIGVIYMELIQLSNGVNILPKKFVQEIVNISRKNQVLVVIDEVATGFGRTGKMFASEYYDIWGDIMMFAKGVTSGYIPMGGVMVTKDIFYTFQGDTDNILDNGFTTGGHPVACAAAIKNIDIIYKQNLIDNSEKMGRYLKKRLLEEVGSRSIVKEIRGKGLMLAIIFENYKVIGMPQFGIADILTRFMINNGLLLYPDSEDILIVAPVLSVSMSKCDYIIEQLRECIEKVEKCVHRR